MIYALIDKETLNSRGVSLVYLLKKLPSISPDIIQYRNKKEPLSKIIEDLKLIKSFSSKKLIVNDYIEAIDFADGLHIGQEDLKKYGSNPKESIERIRATIKTKTLGLSTHCLKEVLIANRLPLDYIGLGAYRTTSTKKEAVVHGEALLAIARHSTHPVALIGGVRVDDVFDNSITYKVVGSGLLDVLDL